MTPDFSVLDPEPSQSDLLAGAAHGFFGRMGGVSQGIYAGLNCGFGSGDDPQAVAENRNRVARFLGHPDAMIATPHQVHGRDVVVVDHVWGPKAGPKADGVVTSRPGVILGILSADCAPVLFIDRNAGVIGAAHAGWRGALAGVTDATIEVMIRLGAMRENIAAVIGPCISQAAYEVGLEFEEQFLAADPASTIFFGAGANGQKRQFHLSGYILDRLRRAGIGALADLALCTYSYPDRYFSFRRTTHRGEPDYGRDISAIVLG